MGEHVHTWACVGTCVRTRAHAQVEAPPEAAAVEQLPVGQVPLHQVHVLAADGADAAEQALGEAGAGATDPR